MSGPFKVLRLLPAPARARLYALLYAALAVLAAVPWMAWEPSWLRAAGAAAYACCAAVCLITARSLKGKPSPGFPGKEPAS